MYYKRIEAHSGYPGLPTVEVGILKSAGESSTEASTERFVSADMGTMLDDIARAEASTPTPAEAPDPYDALEPYDPSEHDHLTRTVESKVVDGSMLSALNGGELSLPAGGDLLNEAEGVKAMITIGDAHEGNTIAVYDLARFTQSDVDGEPGNSRYVHPSSGLSIVAPKGSRYIAGSTSESGAVMSISSEKPAVIGKAPEDAPDDDRRRRFDGDLTASVGPEDVTITVDAETGELKIVDGSLMGTVIVESVDGSAEKSIGDLTGAVGSVAVESVVERPLSARRIFDTKEVTSDTDAELVARLTRGKIADLGTRLKGAKDLRASRKEIISKQHEAMDEKVSDARGAVWNARGARLGNWRKNNFVKRIGQRSDRRQELRDKAFDAIDATGASNPRKTLMRLQARKNAWKEARGDVKTATNTAFENAKNAVTAAKSELKYQKGKRASTAFRPYRRRTTMGGAGSAGFRETWRDAGAELRKKEEQRERERTARLALLKKRQEEAKKRRSREK